VARNRASMREGPLAELFRATEAAQRGQDHEQQTLPTEAASEPEPPDPPEPTPLRAVAPAAAPPAEERRPVARWLDPLPDQPARL